MCLKNEMFNSMVPKNHKKHLLTIEKELQKQALYLNKFQHVQQ
jgi:hypothetical protein